MFSYFFFFFNDTATTEIYTLSLHDALPILVGAGAVAAAGEVDLLLGVLAHVADDQIARGPVEGEAPRIAQPVGPDLRTPPSSNRERIARRDRVAAARPGRDPQQLSEQHPGVLAVVV